MLTKTHLFNFMSGLFGVQMHNVLLNVQVKIYFVHLE